MVHAINSLIKINGETLSALPQDLYIPPDALEVYLEAFEGPLDLLLYLIRKHNLDILDIPMADLTVQYMTYVDKMKAINLELAADYLLMSAMLIEIKSRMLLPKPAAVEEEDDPRAELVRRLMEYEAIKRAAQRLDAMPKVGQEIEVAAAYFQPVSQMKPPEVNLEDLVEAWRNVLKRAKLHQHHKLGRAELSVREHMSLLLRRLSKTPVLRFDELFDVAKEGIPTLVVHFLAMLELAKEGLIRITQQDAFGPIYVQASHSS
ncbi:segregation and condensation protein A [Methylophilus medardicus]|uniref:Segregation and condensation protein A n=1 Tax=Methylophilus medardicus TaxID=2588534 RepID=A0A5B8CTU2_9PROT|nr:ScpA family protein [Methylophilus medardicus]QDC44734.1 segregation/condensation protein A [Methylophilus medardicus]QDC49741.1 segregation/condensation protein A [Methylophilus medardicus]QDC53446.1 segregation/condensation protein A [Methylophilus medardicus]